MRNVVVIGGGIAGLAAAHALKRQAEEAGVGLRCRLIEARSRLGGKIRTEYTQQQGRFVVEGGPDSFIGHKPWALDLVRQLDLEERLVGSNDERAGVYFLHGDRLLPLPAGFQGLVPTRLRPLLSTPLLGWRGKLRVLAEPLLPARRSTEADESVADFVRRRFGSEMLQAVAEPLLASLFVGDVERLSLHAAYPRLAELERRHGSLTRAVRAASAVPAPATVPGGSPPAPRFWTLRGGLEELVTALAQRQAPEDLLLGRQVLRVRPDASPGTFRLRLDDGQTLAADGLVVATPAYVSAALLDDAYPTLAAALRGVRYTAVAVVTLAYRLRHVGHPLDGFGFFVPHREGRSILACTWTSSKFVGRAAADTALLRVFVGGVHHEELVALDDERLQRLVEAELGPILGLRGVPILTRIHRWPNGYPQYDVGHGARVEAIEGALPAGLAVAGNAYRGVGLPDCIQSSTAAAARILGHLERSAPVPAPVDAEAGAW